MKKFISLSIILLLCACSGGLAWDDVKDRYSQIQDSAAGFAQDAKSFLKSDYVKLLDQLEGSVNTLKAGIGKDDTGTADSLYELAAKLDQIASLFKGNQAQQLVTIAGDAKDLVVAAYEKSGDFDSLKTKVLEGIGSVREWADDQWASVEKKERISWESVEADYEAMSEEVIEEMPSRRKVTEIELEQLNEYITGHYEDIMDGVTADNEKIAREIYSAGLQLSEYTDGVEGDTPEKVYDFGMQTMQYVIACHGGPVTLENYSFLDQVQSARKWSLSLWNELTALLKKY